LHVIHSGFRVAGAFWARRGWMERGIEGIGDFRAEIP
jgi:hypothetical protein